MRSFSLGVGLFVLLSAMGCGSSQDSVVVLRVDTTGFAPKPAITSLQVTVDGITRRYAVGASLPVTLGILTGKTGTLPASVVGIDVAGPIGQWSGTVTPQKGKVVTQNVVLSCAGADCGTLIPPEDDGGMNDAGGDAGSDASGGKGGTAGAGSSGNGGTGGSQADAAIDIVDAGSDARTTDDAGKKLLGIACAGASECGSGYCQEGVCCNSACAEPPPNYMTSSYGHACVSCRVPLKVGTCTPLPSGTTAPPGQCFKEYEATCGMDGTCDGKGGCRLYQLGVQCEAGTCSNDSSNTAKTPRVCNGAHNCNSSTTSSCGLFSCSAGVCKTTCGGNSDCLVGASCVTGACQSKAQNGTPCASGSECNSGYCTDGVCCVAGSCANGCFTCGAGLNNAVPGTCQGSRCSTCKCDGACHC